jgi:Na+/melibiose symporter-like transporter
MKRYWPFAWIAFGLAVVVAGFCYAVVFAGIPYQDPTPELTARYNLHTRVASIICCTGGVACLLGGGALLIRILRR